MSQETVICADMIFLSGHLVHMENISFENDFIISACEQTNARKWLSPFDLFKPWNKGKQQKETSQLC